MKRCEYCEEKLDEVYYYDKVIDVSFCYGCCKEYIKSLNWKGIWDAMRRAGEVKEMYDED